MSAINERGVRSAATPNIYIERITLAPGGPVNSRRDSTVDQSRPPVRTTDRFGNQRFETPPAVNPTSPPPIERSLVSILRVSLKDLQNTTTNESTWVYNEPSRRNIVYKVIQSTNEDLTNFLLSSDALNRPNFQIPANYNETIDYQIKTFSLALEAPEDAVVSLEVGSNGNRVLSLEREISFQMVRQPSHLTYFAFTEFYREGQRGRLNAHSPIVIERVINNSSVVKNSYGYTDTAGNVWPGPVHFHRGTGWMEGAYHTSQQHGNLVRTPFFNSKVSDIRVIEGIQELEVDIAPVIPTTEQNETYTTDLYLSRDQNGNSILMFGFNHLRYMQQNSKFGGLFSRATPELRARLIRQSQILEMSIVRQKVRESRGSTSLGSDEIQYTNEAESPVEVVSSYDVDNVIQSRARYYVPGARNNRSIIVNSDEVVSDHYKMFGKIEEIEVENSGRFRMFSAVDANIGSINAGLYKYHIMLRVNDGASSYMAERLQELSLAINVLENYLSIAERSNNYNSRTRRYTVDFINRMSSRRSQESTLPWLAAIVKYIEILDLATNLTQARKIELADCLYSIVSPSTGTNEGVLLLLQLMRELETKVSTIASDNRQSHQAASGPPRSSVSQGASPRFLTDEIHFSEVFDCNILNGSGFDYFEVPNPNPNEIDPPGGALLLRREELRDRLIREVNRYRGNRLSNQDLQNIRFLNEESINALTSEETFYSYIAPNSVDLQGITVPLLRDVVDSLDYITATSIIQNVVDNPSSRSFTTRSTTASALAARLGSGPSKSRLDALSAIEAETSQHQGLSSRQSPRSRTGSSSRLTRRQRRQQNRDQQSRRRRSSEEYFGPANEFTREDVPAVEPAREALRDMSTPGRSSRPPRSSETPPPGATATRRTIRNRVRATSTTEGLDTPRTDAFSFDLGSENNIISTRLLSSGQSPSAINMIRQLPQQIKSLTLNRNQFYNDQVAAASTQNDSEADGFMYNFGMLRRIEYLSGYTANYGKSPNWTLLTESVIDNLNGAVLCRIKKYVDPNTSVGTFHMLDQLPVYNEYFLLTTGENSARPRTRVIPANTSRLRSDGGIPSIDSRSIYGGAESRIAIELTQRATADSSIDGHVEYLITDPYGAPTNSMRITTGISSAAPAPQSGQQRNPSSQRRQQRQAQRQPTPARQRSRSSGTPGRRGGRGGGSRGGY